MTQYIRSKSSIILLLTLWQTCSALDNGVALTPPMGWIYPLANETSIKELADTMVGQGYKDVGYEYLILDSDWYDASPSTNNDKLQPNKERFPNGIKTLADYAHSKGLKFGLSFDAREAFQFGDNLQHDDMKNFAQKLFEWGVDYIKVNDHQKGDNNTLQNYKAFAKFLNETGRPIVHACDWLRWIDILVSFGTSRSTCNSWTSSIPFTVPQLSSFFMRTGFVLYYDVLRKDVQPGHWNSFEYFHLQDAKITKEIHLKQMALWAIFASPLILNSTTLNVEPEIKSIIQNKRIIEVNQDVLGMAGHRALSEGNFEIWTRPISPVINGHKSLAIAVLCYHKDATPQSGSIPLSKLGLDYPAGYGFVDLYSNSTPFMLLPNQELNVTLSSNDVAFFRASPIA